jgi:protocatechuate 3,4-dioxygenase beta subunit
MYSPGVTNENYLRGVQATGDDGRVSFSSIFPGCYAGRWPHIHFEIYPSLMAAASSTGKLSVSQLALPQASCDAVYATSSYQKSVANFRTISLAKDSVFSDGWSLQMASVSGDTLTGYVASLTIGV